MATTADFAEYVCSQIEGVGTVRSRKMFGEYMVYVNNKPIFLVCDNTVFVKMLPELDALMGDAETGRPYKGASEHYILDIDNREHAYEVAKLLETIVPLPKPKKR